jgi:hypothetical protein
MEIEEDAMGYENDGDVEEQQDEMEKMDARIIELEEMIEELEQHLVDDHDCNRPSVFERVCARDLRARGLAQ